jgi:predicted RNase H-like HicB family nuclease
MKNKKIKFNAQVWKEGDMYIAYAPQLDVSSCGKTIGKAKKNIKEAVGLFLSEAQKMGTLDQILNEAGFSFKNEWQAPEMLVFEKMSLAV